MARRRRQGEFDAFDDLICGMQSKRSSRPDLRDGKVAEAWEIADIASLLAQTG